MYALSDVGKKTAGGGRHCQDNGHFRVDHKVSNQSPSLYFYIEELEYQLVTGNLSQSTLLISIY